MTEAPTLAARAASLNPDVIFVDAQPQTFATFVRELERLKAKSIAILTHSVAEATRSGGNPAVALKNALTVNDLKFTFDENDASHRVAQDVYNFMNGQPVRFINDSSMVE